MAGGYVIIRATENMFKTMDHWCTINFDWPRDTTKANYRAISRWLRLVRNKVEPIAMASYRELMVHGQVNMDDYI